MSTLSDRVEATYRYRDEAGALLFEVVRFKEPKDFRQRRPDGNGGWDWSTKGVRRVLYRLPELIAAAADEVVYVLEGEKDADRVAALGLVATTNPGGASKGKSKWRADYNPFFAGRSVVIVPDNDETGLAHADAVTRQLLPIAAKVVVLDPVVLQLPADEDISDWLDNGGSRSELERLAAVQPPVEPPPPPPAPADLAAARVAIDQARPDDAIDVLVQLMQAGARFNPAEFDDLVDRIWQKLGKRVTKTAIKQTIKLNLPPPPPPPPLDPPDWRDLLERDKNDFAYSTAANVLIALRCAIEWAGVFALNEFNQAAYIVRLPPWEKNFVSPRRFSDADEARTLVWMQQNGLPTCRMDAVRQALAVAIDDNRFHPVRDYLDDLVWDGTPRISTWLTNYLGVDPIENYTGPVGRCWLISAVARIYQPGCIAKYCLILEGEQDIGKSTALEILGGDWYTDDIAELGSKDSALQVGNAWIVELAELDSMRRPHVSAVKAFVSRKVDRFRKPFGRNVVEQPRQCVLAGSINPGGEYFVDETGNVRFWPALCTSLDEASLRADRNQLWAEAVRCFKNNEKWWSEDDAFIEAAREQQDARAVGDTWADMIQKYFDGPGAGINAATTAEILKTVLDVMLPEHDKPKQTRVGIIMTRHLKWRRRKIGARRWFERANDTEYPDGPLPQWYTTAPPGGYADNS